MFKELPLYLWRPSAPEIAVIRDWLLNYNLTMVKNKLACVILEGLNWGFGDQVCVKTILYRLEGSTRISFKEMFSQNINISKYHLQGLQILLAVSEFRVFSLILFCRGTIL